MFDIQVNTSLMWVHAYFYRVVNGSFSNMNSGSKSIIRCLHLFTGTRIFSKQVVDGLILQNDQTMMNEAYLSRLSADALLENRGLQI